MTMESTGKILAFSVLFQAYTSITCRLCDFSIQTNSPSNWVRKPCAFFFNNKPETKYIGFEFRLRDDTTTKLAFEVAEANFYQFFHSPLTLWNASCDCTEVPCLNDEQLNKLFVFSVRQSREETKWTFPFNFTLCCSLQQALEEIVYRLAEEQVAALTKIPLKEINMQKWRTDLIDGLRQTEWCESFKAKCDNVVHRISKGCEEERRKKRDIGVKSKTMCGPSSCNHDTGSVSPTPLIKVRETSHLGVQDAMSTSEQRLANSRTLVNTGSQDGKRSEMASLKTSKTGTGSSQERTIGVFSSSFVTEATTKPAARFFLTLVESIALSASSFISSYTTSHSLVARKAISSEERIILTERIRTVAAFYKSTESSWNYTASYSKGKATGIFTAPFHKSDGSTSRTRVHLSRLSTIFSPLHSTHQLSTQTSAVKESIVTGYLAKLSTSKTPVIAYSPVLGTRPLSNHTSTKIPGTISSIHRITDKEKPGKTSVRLIGLTHYTPEKSVPMATDVTQSNASLKSTNSSHELEKSSLFSSKITSGPLQSETLQRSVIKPSTFLHAKSSSALDSASGEISSGQNKMTMGVTGALLVTSLSRSSLTNPVWYKTELLHQSSSSKDIKTHVEATSLALASRSGQSLESSSSSIMSRITLLLTSTSSSSSSYTMISILSSSLMSSSSVLVLHSLSLSPLSSFSSSSSLSSSIVTQTAALPIPATSQLSCSIIPLNSSGLLLSSAEATPSTLSLPVTFSETNALFLTQQSRVQAMSHSSVTSLSPPFKLWHLSSKQSKFKSTVASQSLPLSSLPATFQDPIRMKTSCSTLTSLQTTRLSLFFSTMSSLTLSSSSSSLTTTKTRTATATISPASTLTPSSPTISPLSLHLSLTASLLSIPLESASTSAATTTATSLPLVSSSFSSLSSPLSPYPSSAPLLTTTLKLKSSLSCLPTLPHLTLNTEASLTPPRTTLSSLLLTFLGTKSSPRSSETLGDLSYSKTKVVPSNNFPSLESSSSKPSAASPVANQTFLIKFLANCSAITNEDDFKSSFITALTHLLLISKSDVIVYDVICGSVDVLFVIKSARDRNLTSELWEVIENESFVFTYNGTRFVAFELREILRPSVTPTAYPTSRSTPSESSRHERKKIVFVIFVFIGSVFAALFIFLLVVFLARFSRCCRKTGKLRVRRNGRWHAPFESELKRFAVRRSLFQGINFYGDITQLEEMKQDAEIVEDDIDIEDEFSEIHPVDTNTCLLNGSNRTNSNKVEEPMFVFDDDDSCSSVLFY